MDYLISDFAIVTCTRPKRTLYNKEQWKYQSKNLGTTENTVVSNEATIC